MLIGELARRAGVKPQTVRYYESLGLLSRPGRSPSGYRSYSPIAIDELAFVHKAQSLGFSLEEIRQILDLGRAGRAPCASVLAIAEDHLANLDRRIAQLTDLRQQLTKAVQRWKEGGVPAQCASSLCGMIKEVGEDTPLLEERRPGSHTRVANLMMPSPRARRY